MNDQQQEPTLKGEGASRDGDVPLWQPCTVTTRGEGEDVETPALTHEWCPGLAITMRDFGTFRVSHPGSGFVLGGRYERWTSAALELVQWIAIARAHAIDCTADGPTVRDAFVRVVNALVPFDGATSTSAGVTRAMTVGEWMRSIRDEWNDEFPWEGDDAPIACATRLLDSLRPTAATDADPASVVLAVDPSRSTPAPAVAVTASSLQEEETT